MLANDSSNIVTLIEEEYGRIAEKIIMVSFSRTMPFSTFSKVDDANSSMGLKLSYRSNCLDGKNLMDTNVCDGVKVGDEVDFEVI